jgi:hypothetical protein
MVAVLRGARGNIWLVTGEDADAQNYAAELAGIFHQAGWNEHRSLLSGVDLPAGFSFVPDPDSPQWLVSRAFEIAGLRLAQRPKSSDEPTPAIYIGNRTR